MANRAYQIGDLVWAKMRGHTEWPGRIIESPKGEKLPKKSHCVFFFGTDNHANISQDKIYPYEEYKAKFSQKNKTKVFQKSVQHIAGFIESRNYQQPINANVAISETIIKQEEEDDDEIEEYVLLHRPNVRPKRIRQQNMSTSQKSVDEIVPVKVSIKTEDSPPPPKRVRRKGPESISTQHSDEIIPVKVNIKTENLSTPRKRGRKSRKSKSPITKQAAEEIVPVKVSKKNVTPTSPKKRRRKSPEKKRSLDKMVAKNTPTHPKRGKRKTSVNKSRISRERSGKVVPVALHTRKEVSSTPTKRRRQHSPAKIIPVKMRIKKEIQSEKFSEERQSPDELIPIKVSIRMDTSTPPKKGMKQSLKGKPTFSAQNSDKVMPIHLSISRELPSTSYKRQWRQNSEDKTTISGRDETQPIKMNIKSKAPLTEPKKGKRQGPESKPTTTGLNSDIMVPVNTDVKKMVSSVPPKKRMQSFQKKVSISGHTSGSMVPIKMNKKQIRSAPLKKGRKQKSNSKISHGSSEIVPIKVRIKKELPSPPPEREIMQSPESHPSIAGPSSGETIPREISFNEYLLSTPLSIIKKRKANMLALSRQSSAKIPTDANRKPNIIPSPSEVVKMKSFKYKPSVSGQNSAELVHTHNFREKLCSTPSKIVRIQSPESKPSTSGQSSVELKPIKMNVSEKPLPNTPPERVTMQTAESKASTSTCSSDGKAGKVELSLSETCLKAAPGEMIHKNSSGSMQLTQSSHELVQDGSNVENKLSVGCGNVLEGKGDISRENKANFDRASLFKMQDTTHLRIGVIGLGNVGSKIAQFLLNSHHKVALWNRNNKKYKMFLPHNPKIAKSPEHLVLMCDVIFCCVSTPDAAKFVVFKNHGILHGLMCSRGLKSNNIQKSFVLLTTVDSETSFNIAAAVRKKGGRYLEAPMLNTSCKFDKKIPIFLIAGDVSLFKTISKIFRSFGKFVIYYGDRVGRASKMNLVTSMYFGTVKEILAEVLVLLKFLHLDFEKFMRWVNICQPGNAVISVLRHMNSNRFENPGRALRYTQQDFSLGMQMANNPVVPMPVTQQAFSWFIRAKACGFGRLDSCSVMRTRRI